MATLGQAHKSTEGCEGFNPRTTPARNEEGLQPRKNSPRSTLSVILSAAKRSRRTCCCLSGNEDTNSIAGCPILAASLFLPLGWDTTNLNLPTRTTFFLPS